jgi:hypothetical protein
MKTTRAGNAAANVAVYNSSAQGDENQQEHEQKDRGNQLIPTGPGIAHDVVKSILVFSNRFFG